MVMVMLMGVMMTVVVMKYSDARRGENGAVKHTALPRLA